MKLNLGCGNKVYPREDNWVNVDVVPIEVPHEDFSEITSEGIPEGTLPVFHQSLLENLRDIDDNVADEIHGYHIIEHFYADELVDILKEWKRVLKPGGRICLEQPDVLKCAANLLLGVVRNESQLINNLGILGFFGAGTREQPYMSHKWGWFPQSLAAKLEEAGFVNIMHVPAQTHMKEVRDFRLEAYKGDT